MLFTSYKKDELLQMADVLGQMSAELIRLKEEHDLKIRGQEQGFEKIDFIDFDSSGFSYRLNRIEKEPFEKQLELLDTLKTDIDAAFFVAQTIHEENLPKIEKNKEFTEWFIAFMVGLGFVKEYRESYKKTRSGPLHYRTVTSGWLQDLTSLVKTSDRFNDVKYQYDNLIAAIDRAKNEASWKVRDLNHAKEREQVNKDIEKFIIQMNERYGQAFDKFYQLREFLDNNNSDDRVTANELYSRYYRYN